MGCICSSNSPDTAHEADTETPPDTSPVPEIENNHECVPDHELEDYLTTLKTGDVVLIHGTHLFGKIARVLSWNQWDHVGVVVRVPDDEKVIEGRKNLLKEKPLPTNVHGDSKAQFEYSDVEGGQLQVLEAVGTGTFSYPLKELLQARNAKYKYVGVRKLTQPLSPDQLDQVETFLQSVWARPYQQGLGEFAKAVIKSDSVSGNANKDKDDENLQSIFCSELIAEYFQRANLLPEASLNSNDLLPSAFEEGGTVDRLLVGEASLGGKCVLIKHPANSKHWHK